MEIFTDAAGIERNLTPGQQRALDNVNRRPTTAEAKLIRLADLHRLANGTKARFTLAAGLTIDFDKVRVERRGPGNFTWFGGSSTSAQEVDAILVVQREAMTGSIRYGLELYQVEPIGGGMHALIRVDTSAYPPDGPEPASVQWKPLAVEGSGKAAKPSGGGDLENVTAATSHPVLKVLVAYTPAAASASGNISGKIQLAIDETNTAFAESGVAARVALAHSVQVSYSESSSSNHVTELSRFQGTSDGYMDNVHTLRNDSGADLMVLIINAPSICGRAAAIGATASSAFVTVHQSCVTGNYSFAHELGHLAGNRHNDDTTSSPYSYGHGYYNSSCNFRTIMAVTPSTTTRIKRFSHPHVTYNSCTTGTASFSDAARVWNERGYTLEGFRADPPMLRANLTGPSQVCSPGSVTVTSNPTAKTGCTRGVCSYSWSYRWCEPPGVPNNCPSTFYPTSDTGNSSTKNIYATDLYLEWKVTATCNVTCSGTTTSNAATQTWKVYGPASVQCGGGGGGGGQV